MKKRFSLVLILAGVGAHAQSSQKLEITQQDLVVFLAILVALFAVVVFVYFLYMVNLLKRLMFKDEHEEAERKAFESQGFWAQLFQMKPMGFEKQFAHDIDGITELDNPTPPWFMFLFYSTVGFGLIYMVYYHILGDGNIQLGEYRKEVVMAEAQYEEYVKKTAGLINESNVTALNDEKTIALGKELFDANCVACHGSLGEGKVGPNLTDEYWIHGGQVKDIFKLITEGVPEKGMIAWKKQMNPLQIQQLTSYIVTLQGTNPPNPKEPQGEKASGAGETVEKAEAGI